MNTCRVIEAEHKVLFPALGPHQFMVSQEEDQELFVDVPGFGSVCIKVKGDTLGLYVYPFHVADEPIHEAQLHISEFIEEEG